MKELVNVLNQDGQIVVSSKQIAEDFGKEHRNVIRDIENLISNVGSAQNCAHLFVESSYQHEQNKQWYKEYFLTRDGFSLLVMGFTGTKALEWKLKYIEAFNMMEEKLKNQKQLSPMDQLRLQYQVIENHDLKLNELDTKVVNLENNMVIEYGQEVTIKKEVDIRVRKVCCGNESSAYFDKSLRSKIYRTLWRDYKGYFNITSYHNTLKKDFQTALNLIRRWAPTGELLRDIQMVNNQLAISEIACCK